MDDDMREVLETFFLELSEHVQAANDCILNYETEPDPELINALFRSLHTIKGNSLMLGFDRLGAIAHAAESVAAKLRSETIAPSRQLMDLLLASVDAIEESAGAIKSESPEPSSVQPLIQVLQKVAQGETLPQNARLTAEAVQEKGRPVATPTASSAPGEGASDAASAASTSGATRQPREEPRAAHAEPEVTDASQGQSSGSVVNAGVVHPAGEQTPAMQPQVTPQATPQATPQVTDSTPSARAPDRAGETAETDSSAQGIVARPRSDYSMLVVDDDFVSRKMLDAMLKPYGSCDFAGNGTEAIAAFAEAAETSPYDFVFLDIMLPGADGFEVAKQIRTIEMTSAMRNLKSRKAGDHSFFRHDAIIVMVSALDDPESYFNACYRCGANTYIVKPVSRATIDELFRSYARPAVAGDSL